MPRPPSVFTPELLKTFVTLVRVDGSVTRTAELLDINEASVSKRLKPLHEGHAPLLPRPWLEKHGKLFRVTAEGRRMLPAAEDQLRRWEHFVEFVDAGRLTQLGIGCGHEAVVGIVFDALQRWRQEYRDLPIRISTARGRSRIEAVANGLLDLALVSHDESQIERVARRPLFIEQLLEDPLRLVSAPRARWAKAFAELTETGVRPAALVDFPLILPEGDAGLRGQLDRHLFKAGVLNRLHVVMEVGGWHAQLAYVREGVGVAMAPASVLARHGKGLLTRPLAAQVAPPHKLRLICRIQPTGEPDLSEAGLALRRLLHESAV
ncbi:MAG TPA: LysR family transcriptional regulator [Gemmataceae bacterium]|nr:LysR family transcriptional regulator [Gemmataceae bacterium]